MSRVADQVRGLEAIGVEVEVLLADRRGDGRAAYRGLGRRVVKRLREGRYDLVHPMYGGVMADAVTRAVRDRPVVVSFCGSDLLGPAPGIGALASLSVRYGVRASQRAAARAGAIIVKSENLRAALRRPEDRRRAQVIPNGVDLERFRPLPAAACRRELGWKGEGPHILFPGDQDSHWKRPRLAHAAVAALRRRGIDAELHMMAGVPHREVPRWMGAADLLLLTSLHEGSPNVVKEALACGLRCVSVDVGDVRERLRGGASGLMAEPRPEDLAAKLVRAPPAPREPLAGIAELSLEAVAARIRSVYETALNVA